ncbi:MAG TPA: hypothetical protein VGD22_13425 [Sphingobacteriaceae bacterium]
MKRHLNTAKTGIIFLIITLLASISVAQQTTKVDINVDENADSGILTGSPWLWLLFIAIFIIVIVVLTRGRRDS